jgi:hypothetical protein
MKYDGGVENRGVKRRLEAIEESGINENGGDAGSPRKRLRVDDATNSPTPDTPCPARKSLPSGPLRQDLGFFHRSTTNVWSDKVIPPSVLANAKVRPF